MSSEPLRLAAVVATSLVAAALCSPVLAAGDALTNAQYNKLTQIVVPAFENGDSLGVLKGLSPLLTKLKPAAMREADALLKRHMAPPVDHLLTAARRALIRQGMTRKMPKASKFEVLLVLPVLHRQVADMLKGAKDHAAWKEPPGKDGVLKEYGLLFEAMHVLDSELASIGGVAQYAAKSGKMVSRVKPATLSEAQREAVAFDFAAAEKTLAGLRSELRERAVELRIKRLSRAADVLENSQVGTHRYEAAYAAGVDKGQLDVFFKTTGKKRRGKFTRPALNELGLEESVQKNFERAEKAAGDLMVKSRLLFDGLAWWLRGRYGRGPHAGGLLKDAEVLVNPQAQVALLMPAKRPRPIPPPGPNSSSVPDYDRRHHYTWAWENRQSSPYFKTKITKSNATIFFT
ncbi:MAG: hypothetical protein IID44_30705 [Planctomycetes bacterium]|nr:hypothetical protein [Planctomycetota bacterium]